MKDQPIGLRERKKLATRAALADEAQRLAMETGVDNFTVDDVTRVVGVSARTFFNYFASKEEAIVYTSRVNVERVVRALRARPANESLGQAMRAAMGAIRVENKDVPQEWMTRLRLTHQSPSLLPAQLAVYSAVERALADAVAERAGCDPASLYPTVVAASVLSAWRATGTWWIEHGDNNASFDSLVDQMVDQLILGVDRIAH